MSTDSDQLIEVVFTQPADQINLNDRLHWRPRNDLTQAWRNASYIAGLRTASVHGRPAWGKTVVDVRLPVRTNHKRDPHNWTPTVKAIVDGLTDARFWPDDNSDYVRTNEPTFGLQMHNAVIVRLRPEEVRQ